MTARLRIECSVARNRKRVRLIWSDWRPSDAYQHTQSARNATIGSISAERCGRRSHACADSPNMPLHHTLYGVRDATSPVSMACSAWKTQLSGCCVPGRRTSCCSRRATGSGC